MKERPILFSGPMVRAILEGRKTQTRRVVGKGNSVVGSGVPWDWLSFEPPWPDHCLLYPDGRPTEGGQYLHVPCKPHPDDPQTDKHWTVHRVYPRIEPGMRLWVLEIWAAPADLDRLKRPLDINPETPIRYRASQDKGVLTGRWRNSIYMPRWASRITLEVTAVRVERLQEISHTDTWAEGIERFNTGEIGEDAELCIATFSELWESINGAGSWDANPWVWVIQFARMTPTPPMEQSTTKRGKQ